MNLQNIISITSEQTTTSALNSIFRYGRTDDLTFTLILQPHPPSSIRRSALILSHDTIYETALRSIPQIKSGTVRTPFIPPDFRIKNINFRLRISVYASSSTSRIPIDLRIINIDR